MEKYYILGTTLVCLICNLVPYASGKFGHVYSNSLRMTLSPII
jgi:hypothetical protein